MNWHRGVMRFVNHSSCACNLEDLMHVQNFEIRTELQTYLTSEIVNMLRNSRLSCLHERILRTCCALRKFQ